MGSLIASSGDPDQTLHSVASYLGLQCFPVILSLVPRIKWATSVPTAMWNFGI